MTAKIVVVGDFNVDLVTYMAHLPKPGETLNGRSFITGPGGKGSNQAIGAARLGADVTFVGRVGKDHFAQIGLQLWAQEKINTDYMIKDSDNPTGIATIFVEDAGENMIVVAQGANLALTPDDVDAATEAIARADVLITQLSLNYETVAYALKTAKEQSTRTILNPAPAGRVPAELLSYADYITPNENELYRLAGRTGEGVEEAARSLLSRDGQTVIVTLGAQGARWIGGDKSERIPTFQVEVVDTVGAGDAFNAGFAVALAEERSLPEAIAFANAAAALCVTQSGASAAMPRRDAVDSLLKQGATR